MGDDCLEEIARMSEASTRRLSEASVSSSAVGASTFEFDGTADVSIESGYLIRLEKTRKRKSMGLELGIVKNVGLGDWTSGGLRVQNVNRGLVRRWNQSHSMKVY